MRGEEQEQCIVVGSGVAGLSAALAAARAGAPVRLITAGALQSGSSSRAQGGVAASVGADDAPSLHAADTLAVGDGLNDAGAVRVLVEDGQTAVRELVLAGVDFDRGPGGLQLGLEAGHGRRRILHGGGGATGWMLTGALVEDVLAEPRITVHEQSPVDELLFEDGAVAGVRCGEMSYRGRAVVLATGGYAALWGRSTNGPESRGAGLALAWTAGATLADLEFVQFHPTALDLPGRPAYLLSEALRGEGARVVDVWEQPVADPLLPRDQLARAVARHRWQHGPVYLSLRHLDAERVRTQFASLAEQLEVWGLDIARDLLPIAPAAHYCMGGIRTDTDGRTDVPGLYAAGEVACTGVQGANRLASNSLLECLVFGERSAEAALIDRENRAAHWHTAPLPEMTPFAVGTASTGDALPLGERLDRYLGVERDAAGLTTLLTGLSDSGETWLAATAARAALLRRESRGAHYRADAPVTDPRWRGRIHWRRDAAPRFEEVLS